MQKNPKHPTYRDTATTVEGSSTALNHPQEEGSRLLYTNVSANKHTGKHQNSEQVKTE